MPPLPVFRALAEKFPDVEFTVQYAGECCGEQAGTITYTKEDGIVDVPAMSEDEAKSIFADVWGYTPGDDKEEA